MTKRYDRLNLGGERYDGTKDGRFVLTRITSIGYVNSVLGSCIGVALFIYSSHVVRNKENKFSYHYVSV